MNELVSDCPAENQELKVVKETRILVKCNKTDPVFQRILVRRWSDGSAEYYRPQLPNWFKLPTDWETEF